MNRFKTTRNANSIVLLLKSYPNRTSSGRFLIKSSAIFLRKKKGIRMDVFIDYQKQGPFRDLIRYFLKYFLSAFTMMRSSVHFKIGSNPCLLCFKAAVSLGLSSGVNKETIN